MRWCSCFVSCSLAFSLATSVVATLGEAESYADGVCASAIAMLKQTKIIQTTNLKLVDLGIMPEAKGFS